MAAGYPSLFLINLFHSSSSWLTHSTPRPHLFYTDTMKETQLERERIEFLICPCLLFQTSSRGRLPLPLSLLCYPPLSPSNLLPETRDTLNFTPSPFFPPLDQLFCGTECVTGPFSATQEIPQSAKVTAGKDTHSYSSAGSQFPPLPLSFLAFMSFLFLKTWELQRASGGRILFIQSWRNKQKQFRGDDEKRCYLCATLAAPLGIWSHNMFLAQSTISHKHFKGL